MGPLVVEKSIVLEVKDKDALIRIQEQIDGPSYDLVLLLQCYAASPQYPFSTFYEDFFHKPDTWIGFSYPNSLASASSLHNHVRPFSYMILSIHKMVR